MMIVAHPDDEDGALLTYLSRGLGVRATLFTLTRGEGGQNAMSAELYDALGIIRTNELLKADQYYGAKQLWGTEVDFGFSKTQEESFQKWTHDRVLYDAVLAVRSERPQVIVSTFVGGITDGHGQHQVSGEIAQEVFKAAADPTVFPEQLKPVSEGGLGLQPWQPLAVYSMMPFAPVTDKGMFDYATGKWAPAKFKNYVTGEVTTTVPSTDVTHSRRHARPNSRPQLRADRPRRLGRTEVAERRRQPIPQRPRHRQLSPVGGCSCRATQHPQTQGDDEASIKTATSTSTHSISGLAHLVKAPAPEWLVGRTCIRSTSLSQQLESKCPCNSGPASRSGTRAHLPPDPRSA